MVLLAALIPLVEICLFLNLQATKLRIKGIKVLVLIAEGFDYNEFRRVVKLSREGGNRSHSLKLHKGDRYGSMEAKSLQLWSTLLLVINHRQEYLLKRL